MKILAFHAENFKRIKVVTIKPDGNMVEITGKNAQGKISVLDEIYVALSGMAGFKEQTQPIRKGQTKATLNLDLGEINVTRVFREVKGSGKITTELKVTNKDGFTAHEPQKMLDAIVGPLSIDPLSFYREKPAQQYDVLKSLVQGFDFEANAAARAKAFEERTIVNRQAKETEALADACAVSLDLPDEPVDEAALMKALVDVSTTNTEIENRRRNREAVAQKISELLAEAASLPAKRDAAFQSIKENTQKLIEAIDDEIRRLNERRAAVIASGEDLIKTGLAESNAAIQIAERKAAELQQKLDEAPELPEPVNAASIAEQLDQARQINAEIRRREERDNYLERLKSLVGRAKALTEAIAKADADKAAAVMSASLPVPGLTFGDGEIMLDGLPLSQASDAARLRVSCAIAMALAPKLRVVRVRDGSLLDSEGLQLLAEMAAEKDMQVWIERVSDGEDTGFVLVDGHLAGVELPLDKTEQGELM